MKEIIGKRLVIIFIFILLPVCYAAAQCTYESRALGNSSEVINYNLYFNWKFIWIKAGTASMITQPIVYNGKNAYRSSLVTRSSETVDKYFMMRDTIMAYFSTQLTPLYYRKGAREGKRYYVDEVWYSYSGDKCTTSLKHLTSSGDTYKEKFTYDRCVSDMLNSFQKKYNCLVLSYIEKEEKKDKEIVRFYVTDDNKHVPVRLDMFLRFGSAKAFLK